MALSYLLALLAASVAVQGSGATLAPAGSTLEHYGALLYLFDQSFQCQSTHWSAQEAARFRRMETSLRGELNDVRDALIAREGREPVQAMQDAFDARWNDAEPPWGCDFGAMARSRPHLRTELHALERRLGLVERGAARRSGD